MESACMKPVGGTIKWDRTRRLSQTSQSMVTHGEFLDVDRWIPCAVKRIDRDYGQGKLSTQYREIIALRSLNEKINNVIEYYGEQETEDHWYVACELFDCDLAKYINSLADPADVNFPSAAHQRLSIAKQAAQGLCFVHNKDWVHKDIKPSNFLIRRPATADGCDATVVCKVADLGFAKPILQGTDFADLSTRLGTLLFMAPELLKSEKAEKAGEQNSVCFKKEHDVWAMGCVLHFILTGFYPFSRDINPLAKYNVTLNNIDSGDAVSLAPLDWIRGGEIGFETLIRNMIGRDPSKRPNMNDVKDEINSWHL